MVLGAWRQNELLQGACFVLSVWMGVIVAVVVASASLARL